MVGTLCVVAATVIGFGERAPAVVGIALLLTDSGGSVWAAWTLVHDGNTRKP